MTTLTIFVDDEQVDLKGSGYIADVNYNSDAVNALAVSAFNHQLELLDIPIEINVTVTEGNLLPEKLAWLNNLNHARPVTVTITAKRLPHPTKKPKYLTMYYRKEDGKDNDRVYWGAGRFDDLNLASDTKPCTIDLDNPQEWVVGYPTTVPAGLVELGSSRLVNYLTALTIDVSEPNNDVTPYVANMVGNLAAYDPRVPIAMVRLQNTSETERRVKINSDEVNFALMDFGSGNGYDLARIVANDEPFSLESETSNYGNYSIIIPPLKDAIVCLTNSKINDGALPRYPMPTEETPLGVDFNIEHHTWKNASFFYRIATFDAQNLSVVAYGESVNPITGVNEYGFFIIFPERVVGSGEVIYDIGQRADPWGTQYYRQNDIKYITWPGGPDIALAGEVFKDGIVANSNYGKSGAILYVPEGHSAAMYFPWNTSGFNYSLPIRTLTNIMHHLNIGWVFDINIPQLADSTWMGKFNINNIAFVEYIQPWPQKDTLFPKMRSGLPVHYGVANLVLVEGLQTLSLTVGNYRPDWKYNIDVYVTSELNAYLGKAVDEPCNPIFSLALDSAEQNPVGYSKSESLALVPISALSDRANIPLTLVVNTEYLQAGWYLEVDAIKGNPI